MCMHQKHTASRDLGWSRAESTSHRNCMWLTVRRDQGPCKPPIQAKGWADTEKTLRIIVCGKGSCIILCNTMQTSNMLHATSVNLAASPSSNFVSWGFQEGNSTYALWSVMYLCSPRSKNCVLDFYDAQVSTAFERCWVNRVFATRTSNQVCVSNTRNFTYVHICIYMNAHTQITSVAPSLAWCDSMTSASSRTGAPARVHHSRVSLHHPDSIASQTSVLERQGRVLAGLRDRTQASLLAAAGPWKVRLSPSTEAPWEP